MSLSKDYVSKSRHKIRPLTTAIKCYSEVMEKISAYTDGEARGNPGPAAVGIYITNSAGEMVYEAKKFIGNANSNFAEYYAVMLALQSLKEIYNEKSNKMQFEICLSSELVKKQLSTESQIKEPGLVPMFIEIHNMKVESFPNIFFTLLSREKNIEANRLLEEALDGA